MGLTVSTKPASRRPGAVLGGHSFQDLGEHHQLVVNALALFRLLKAMGGEVQQELKHAYTHDLPFLNTSLNTKDSVNSKNSNERVLRDQTWNRFWNRL
jgi:hypothetical protein